jgi:hypothetical protein
VTQRRVGKGRIIWGRTLREVLLGDGVPPDFEHSSRDAFVDFIHRTAGETEIYFIANRKNGWERLDATFRVAGRLPEFWDPVAGTTRPAARYAADGRRTTLPVELAPYGSLFVVFPKTASAPSPDGRNFVALKPVQELSGPWRVQADSKWGWPEPVMFEKLQDWTKRKEDGIKFFSGTATYQAQFDLSESLRQEAGCIHLDLGKVRNLAEVTLNGKNLGVVWTEPFRLDITHAVKPEGNVLEIAVTNLWWNRLVGDAGLSEDKRFAKTNVRVGKDSPLLESGLLGPVTLQAP